MSALLAALKAKGIGIAIGAGSVLVLGLLARIVPNLVSKHFSKYLDKALDVEKPEDKELVLALVKWAEIKFPDRGKGQERFKLAAEKLVGLLPFLKGKEAKIAQMIEEAVWRMDEELKKRR